MFKRAVNLCMLFIFITALCAQENSAPDRKDMGADGLPAEVLERVMLANSVKDYPVTPGDVYRLTYLSPRGSQTLEIVVQGDLSLNLSIFGVVQAGGLTYQELRVVVEKTVQRAYPESRPQLTIMATGIFQVYLKGEVKTAGHVNCWGLSHLGEVISGRTTPYSSLRDIEIRAGDGKIKLYDLFSALRFGQEEEDPYVKPGNIITIKKAERQVKIYGEILHPGTYQLLAADGLKELISGYGGGFSNLSDAFNIRVVRIVSAEKQKGEVYYLSSLDSLYKDFMLHDLDEIYIPSKKDSLPVVYFEGALMPAENAAAKGEARSEKYTYRFVPGQKLSSAIQELNNDAGFFAPEADLQNSYLIRSGEDKPIPVDIAGLIHNYAAARDVILAPYDRVVIPFRQYFVTVSGAVVRPGHYPYMPNRSYKYYLQLAGGTDPQKNTGERVIITDARDTVQSPARTIQPDDTIYAEYNNALYHANQWAVLVGTAVSVTALVLTIIQLSK